MARKSKQERRGEALDAAKRLLSREGMQAASVRKVAEEAGMSAGSLRHIFPSHDELFVALLEDGRSRAREQLAAVNDLSAGNELSLDQAVDALMELVPVHDEARIDALAQLSVQTDHPDNEALLAARQRAGAGIDALCHAIAAANCRREEVAFAALELRLLFDGLTMRVLENDSFGEPEARAVLHRCLRSLCYL